MKIINMKSSSYARYFSLLFILTVVASNCWAQVGDQLPVREYTNPDEVVTFDRTTSFSRALDVVNQFAQQYRGKMIIDRTGTQGNIGISIPPMHWKDALEMILNMKRLRLIEQPDYYEIVAPPQSQRNASVTGPNTVTTQAGEGPVATIDTREVRINAIFFEGNRRALSEIGVDWSTLSQNVPESVLGDQGGGQGGEGGQIPSAEFEGPFVQVNAKGAQNVSQSVFDALVNFGEVGNSGIEVQALFSAFEADNLGEILASPTVKVMDGEEGRIQVGQDFSIKQRDFAGNVVEQFFSVGTILTVTPQIIEQQDTTFIHLDITAERSSAQPDPVSTVINKTQAQTQSLLMDEEATVIAGLYRTEYAEVRRGVPILKDLPGWFFGLRYLFGYNSKDLLTRELVIIIQASIEPSVPERYGKELPDKFDILQDKRSDYEQEMKQWEEIQKGRSLDELDEDDDQFQEIEEDTTAMDPVINNEPAKEAQELPQNKEAWKDTTKTPRSLTEKQMREDTSLIVDPELQGREIPLHLGESPRKDTAKVSQRDDEDLKEQQGVEQKVNSNDKYFIIGGSFSVYQNAVSFSRKLQAQGYSPVIIDNPRSNSKMVAYQGYQERSDAVAGLKRIQQQENASAWLFVAK